MPHLQAQQAPNWTKAQLLEPAVLAETLRTGKDLPLILSVGPGALIPQSVGIGPTNEPENLLKLKQQLAASSKTKAVVVYCGCCPFEHCPNVRPAIALLKATGFTNYTLLNLPRNLKTDWIDKGYPVTGK